MGVGVSVDLVDSLTTVQVSSKIGVKKGEKTNTLIPQKSTVQVFTLEHWIRHFPHLYHFPRFLPKLQNENPTHHIHTRIHRDVLIHQFCWMDEGG